MSDPEWLTSGGGAESDETYRSIFERSRVVKLLVDPADGTIVDVNPAAAAFYGRSRDELRHQPVSIITATPEERLVNDLATAAEAGNVYVITQHRLASGALRDVEIYATVIQAEGRSVLYSIVHDLTERRRAEQMNHYLADLLQNVSDAVISTDLSLTVQSWNQAAVQIYGLRAEEAVGRPIFGLLGQRMSAEAYEQALATLFERGSWQGEVVHRHHDGAPVQIFSSVTVVRDASGEPVGIVAVNRDVTSRRQVEEQLRQRVQLEQLVAQISADFINRPLAEIDAGIESALSALGRFTAADRVEMFLFQGPERQNLVRSHTYVAPHAPATAPRRNVIPIDALPWARDAFTNKRPTIVQQLNELPPEAAVERALLEAFGIQAIAGVPLMQEGAVVGLLTLESGGQGPVWDEQTREMLSFIGDIVSNALDRKWRELALRQSQERFQQLVESTPIIPFEMELEALELVYVGPQFERLLGFAQTDWRRPGFWLERVHPEDRARLRRRLGQEASKSNGSFQIEYRVLAHEERVIWFRSVATVTHDEGRALLRGFLLDITERRQAEEAYQQLVEHSLQGLIVIQDGKVSIANRTATRIIGYGVDELKALGLPYLTAHVFPPGRLADQEGERPALVRAGEESPIAHPIVTPQGTERWIELSTTAIELHGRPALQVLLVDVSARRLAEETMRQAQKMESLGLLAGGVAHDFNNLLVAMLGQASLAQYKLAADAPAASHIGKVIQAAERAADLTRQMLAYSGQGQFEVKAMQLNQIIQENLHLFEVAMPKNVALRSQLYEPLPRIEADMGQMQQVIMNLILNGAEAIGEGSGTVLVQTHVCELEVGRTDLAQFTGKPLAAGTYVELSVTDNGSGMDPATISRIFDPFFTTKFTGRGLGLAAVLGIVRAHAGGLVVDSLPGRGTTFRLVFPVSVGQPEPPPTPAPARAPEQRRLILVIDDEEAVREAVSEILELDGWQTLTAADGVEGLALIQSHADEIGLVVLDLSMPGMSGKETFSRLQRTGTDVPVVLFSGYSRDIMASRFDSQQMPSGFLQKPFNAQQLIDIVRQHARE